MQPFCKVNWEMFVNWKKHKKKVQADRNYIILFPQLVINTEHTEDLKSTCPECSTYSIHFWTWTR